MVISAGALTVDPEEREDQLVGCVDTVQQAWGRQAGSTSPSVPLDRAQLADGNDRSEQC